MTRARVAHGAVIAGGLALMTLAVVLGLARPTGARAGHAIPVVNRGTVPSPKTPASTSPPIGHATRRPAGAIPTGSRLRLTRLGLNARIRRVSTFGRVMQIPRDPREVGWWTGGAAPGWSGTTVVVGHINFEGVAGALSVLPRARPGDRITLDEPRRDLPYRVVAVRSYAKSTGLPADLFTRDGPSRLVLITCGGSFDPATGNYRDNIVTYAEPA